MGPRAPVPTTLCKFTICAVGPKTPVPYNPVSVHNLHGGIYNPCVGHICLGDLEPQYPLPCVVSQFVLWDLKPQCLQMCSFTSALWDLKHYNPV